MNTTTASPAVMYARIFGVVLTLAGIVGLFVNTDQNVTKSLLGFDVNLTHNFVHLATGVVGLIVGFMVLSAARTYALVFGVVYTVLAVWGLVHGNGFNPFGIFGEINRADHFLHLALGVAGVGAYIASPMATRERANHTM
ncbi:MAG: DUF4383 domain-containing protein [Thermoleophilia bacterium]|nr:DUF4383 domain-containing protein [Thermoleophilia bacterium]